MARAKAKGRGTPARAVLAGGISSSAMAMLENHERCAGTCGTVACSAEKDRQDDLRRELDRAPDLSAEEIAEAVVRGSSDPDDGPALSPTVEEMLEELQQDWTVSLHTLGKKHWNIRLRSAIVNAPTVKHELDASSLREAVCRAYELAMGAA